MKNGQYIDSRYPNRHCVWYQDDQIHRDDDLPAIEFDDGEKRWYQYGKLHRQKGPAIIVANGRSYWFLDGIEVDCKTQEEFEKLMRLKAFW